MNRKTRLVAALAIAVILMAVQAYAQPTGTTITFNETDSPGDVAPDSRTDDGGTITTIVVDALQQNPRWKAYIGNITGSLTLDDSDENTIFSWALDPSDITGEIYSSRNDTVSWTNIQCAAIGTITAEDTFLGISSTAADSINRTFNETTHPPLTVGTTNIGDNTCRATSTFVNSARQSQASADFPLILLDDTSNLVYVSPINPETTGYDGSSLFDFQLILANNPNSTTPYYFYVELG
jgi:hypothetical protein